MAGWWKSTNQLELIINWSELKNYIEDSMMQHYMEFDEDYRDESRFWDHIFPQAEFDKSNKKYKATADKKRREKLFEEKDMIMVYLRKGKIST